MVLLAESRGSKNRILPSSTLSGVWGLPTGTGSGPSTRSAPKPAGPGDASRHPAVTAATTSGATNHHDRQPASGRSLLVVVVLPARRVRLNTALFLVRVALARRLWAPRANGARPSTPAP